MDDGIAGEIIKWVGCGLGWAGWGQYFLGREYSWYKVRKLFNENTICTLYDKSIRILNFIVRTVNQNFKLLSTYCLMPQNGMILFITVAHCDEMFPCSCITNTMPHNSYG